MKTVLVDEIPESKDDFFFIGVSGTRKWYDYKNFSEVMTMVFLALQEAYMLDREEMAVVSGGATGVDEMAEAWAKEMNLPMFVIKPDWKRWGKAAGPIRNSKIVELADTLVAFSTPNTTGTMDTLKKARKKGIPVFQIELSPDGELDEEIFQERWDEFINTISPF